jgi:PAS domain S-box-containing protein
MPGPIDYEQLFQRSPNPYMLLDRELRFVTANAAYLAVTGRRLDELVGRPLFEVFPNDPDDPGNIEARRLRESLLKVLETGEPDVLPLIPYRVPRPGEGTAGVVRYWSATHTPIVDADGRVAFVMQHTVDVTELQQLRSATPSVEAGVLHRANLVQEENELLDAERRHLSELFAQAPGFVTFLSVPDFVFVNANAAYSQLVGHREIIGRRVEEALPEIVGQGFIELLERVRDTRQPFIGRGIRVVLQRSAGGPTDEKFLDFIYQPIVGPGGRVIGILVQGHDITEQRRLELELATQVETQHFLADSIPQQVWTATPDGALDSVNVQVREYFGADDETILGQGWQAIIHPDDLAGCVARWQHSLTTGEPYETEFRLRGADGVYRWHLARAKPFRDAAGRIVRWFGTNTDMDDLKRAQDALQARAELDRQLIGIVSHDLRNPLNAIGVGIAILKRSGLSEQHAGVVDRMLSSFERASRLIRDFLDFAQVRVSGEFPVRRATADAGQIARQVRDEIQPLYPGRECRLECDGPQSGNWDPDRLNQLIGNLLSNAFQHSAPNAPVTLRVCGGATELEIAVHNDGNPIPVEERARLFRPFERGRDSRQGPGASQSFGLGLYISDQIVRAHGGTIHVESGREIGTTFIVRLPY